MSISRYEETAEEFFSQMDAVLEGLEHSEVITDSMRFVYNVGYLAGNDDALMQDPLTATRNLAEHLAASSIISKKLAKYASELL